MKTLEANATTIEHEEDNSQGKQDQDATEDGEEQDQLYALLTQSKQACAKTPPSNKQGQGTKPLPGNVNRLLSKAMSRS